MTDGPGEPDGPSGADGPSGPEEPASRPWWRREGAAFVELFALAGLAVAQPLLDVFGRNPTQFVFREATGRDIVLFALAITLVVPVALWGAGALVGCASARVRRLAHLAAVAVLVGALAMQAGRTLATGAPLVVAAALAAGAGVVLVARVAAFRLWLRFAAVAPIAFLALFLFASDTAPLLRGGGVETADVVVGAPAPVVMLVFDEFPLMTLVRADGTIDDELYPNIAELAAGSTWFRNTTSVSNSTWYAVPAIATGKLPVNAAPVAADHPENLFTLLGQSYGMNVSESFTRLCPSDVCDPQTTTTGREARRDLFGDAAALMRDRLSYSGETRNATAGLVEAAGDVDDAGRGEGDNPFEDFGLNQPDRYRTFLEGLDDTSLKLHYLHILLPHVPHRYLPSGVQYDHPIPELGRGDDDWLEEPWFTTLARQRLQLQVGYLDALVGQLLDTLRANGLYDEALIVMTADHGMGLQPGGTVRGFEGQPLDEETLGELLWVPFILKRPGQTEGIVSDANVLTVDVLPTIADVLDVDLPWPVDGRSAFGPARPDDTKPFHRSEPGPMSIETRDPVDFDGDEGWRHVLDVAVDRFLPPTGEPNRLWRPGPGPEPVGMAVADAPGGAWELVDAELLHPERYDIAPGATTVPALVQLRVAAEHRGERLAVAVNGVVGAVAPAVDTQDGTELIVMVDDALFRPGPNQVTVHRPPA